MSYARHWLWDSSPINARVFIVLMLGSFWEGNCWWWKLMYTIFLLCSQVSTFQLFSIHLFLHYFILKIDFHHTIYYDKSFPSFNSSEILLPTLSLSGFTSILFLSLLRKEIGWEKRKVKAWFHPEEGPLRKIFYKVRLKPR